MWTRSELSLMAVNFCLHSYGRHTNSQTSTSQRLYSPCHHLKWEVFNLSTTSTSDYKEYLLLRLSELACVRIPGELQAKASTSFHVNILLVVLLQPYTSGASTSPLRNRRIAGNHRASEIGAGAPLMNSPFFEKDIRCLTSGLLRVFSGLT